MVFTTFYFLSALMLFSTTIILVTNAAVYNPRRIILPDDDEIQPEIINDLLQREYADRYRDYLEKSLLAFSKNNMDDIGAKSPEFYPFSKRGQTFVRFGKRS